MNEVTNGSVTPNVTSSRVVGERTAQPATSWSWKAYAIRKKTASATSRRPDRVRSSSSARRASPPRRGEAPRQPLHGLRAERCRARASGGRSLVATGAVAMAGRLVVVVVAVTESLNSRIPLPSERPISGSRFGPKTSRIDEEEDEQLPGNADPTWHRVNDSAVWHPHTGGFRWKVRRSRSRVGFVVTGASSGLGRRSPGPPARAARRSSSPLAPPRLSTPASRDRVRRVRGARGPADCSVQAGFGAESSTRPSTASAGSTPTSRTRSSPSTPRPTPFEPDELRR